MYILKLSCPDQPGIVAAVSSCLHENGCNIEEAAQFHEPEDNHFFMRIIFSGERDGFEHNFKKIIQHFQMNAEIHQKDQPVKALILVSQWDHCLNDLLYRADAGHLNLDITGIVSNHEKTRIMTERHITPFHKIDVTPETKDTAEQKIAALIRQTETDLVILARYMQILSNDFCNAYSDRMINIHHSFLPGFKGAKPYQQAYDRGVKMIGATAHFVTSDLDEGPIITQDVQQIDHTYTPKMMQALGRDIERQALAKAVKLYSEHRIFLHNKRTVIL